jgi:hypothetical protein
MRIRNIHERRVMVGPALAGALFDTLASRSDRLWPGGPAGRWPRMRLDRPLSVGARGGHAAIRYRVVAYEPGRSVAFEFEDEGMTRGLRGGHRFEVEPAGAGAVLRHVIEADAIGAAAVLRWLVLLRPVHDAVLEDALDRAEREFTGTVARPARWSPWVRFLHAALMRKPRRGRDAGRGSARRRG